MFWENLIALCAKNEITPSALVKKLSIANGAVTKWKNGAIPHQTTLHKIADYFGVTTEQLVNDLPLEELKGLDEKDTEILNMYSRLSDEHKKQALSYLQYLAEHKAHEET